MLTFEQVLNFWLSQTLEVKQAKVPEALQCNHLLLCSLMCLAQQSSQGIQSFLHFDALAILILIDGKMSVP